MPRTVLVGRPHPQGSSWDGAGVNFAIYSENAERVELCLFESKDGAEERIAPPERTNHVWHGYLPGLQPGALYLYRAHGPLYGDNGTVLTKIDITGDTCSEGDRIVERIDSRDAKGNWTKKTIFERDSLAGIDVPTAAIYRTLTYY